MNYPTIKNAAFLGNGWDFLLEKLYNYITWKQKGYLKLMPKYYQENIICESSDEPIFNCSIEQIKEKFGQLRIYLSISAKELDWDRYDKEDYLKEYNASRNEIRGYVDALESISSNICEISGERGTLRDIKGWMRTLSDAEFNKLQ